MLIYPKIATVHQAFDRTKIDDVAKAVRDELATLDLGAQVRSGQSVALTAGSRGIDNIEMILRTVVDFLKDLGAEPFIVPAMGSHGGGTVPGQLKVLAALGLSEDRLGCPIRASMETVILGNTEDGVPIHFDRIASEADHLLVCGRVKLHTGFDGVYQSGLMKMLLNGLGKHEGAKTYHRASVELDFDHIVQTACPIILKKVPIVAGLAIVENSFGATAKIAAVASEDFDRRQRELLVESRSLMASLPLDQIDVLLIDEIGKSISGTGMDTNIIGRKQNDHAAVAGETPAIRTIAVRSVVGGNANGIGLAEFCTARAVAETNWKVTRINGLTAMHAAAAMMPIDFPTDQEMLDAALKTIGLKEPVDARLVWIKNTKELEYIACSEACFGDLQSQAGITIDDNLNPLPFDQEGNLSESILRPSG
jgi:hypothetical protein